MFDNFPDTGSTSLNPYAIDQDHVLNVFTGDMPSGAYGWGNFASQATASSDYVLVDYVTLPGGASPPSGIDFDDGDILVHEVGHYLGLKHVFNTSGRCDIDNDGLGDTPICWSDNSFIGQNPVNSDTCTNQLGLDPTDNYMHVTGDDSRDTFTSDQEERMDQEVLEHRDDLDGSTIYFTSNLTIASNQVWHFFDSTIKFSSGKKITVNGTLNADDVTFTASGSSWNGIYYASGSEGTLDNVDITKIGGGAGGAGVKIYNAEPHIEDSFIDVNTGSYVYGVYMSGSYHTATIYRTAIRSKSAPAVYVTGSYNYLFLYDTDLIQESSSAAVYASNSGRPYFWPGAVSPYVGYDKVKGGRLYASGNAVISAGSASSTTSRNHFCNAASSSLEATSGGTIYARYNYWYNNNDPAEDDHGESGTIYYSNKLGAANCSDVPYRVAESGSSPIVLNEEAPAGMVSASWKTQAQALRMGQSSDLREMLFEAKEKITAKRYAEATALLQSIVESGVMPEAHSALLELGVIFRETKEASLKGLFNTLTTGGGPLRATALSILAGAHALQKQDQNARAALDELIQSYSGKTEAFYGQLSLVNLHIDAGRFAEAAQVLGAIEPGSREQAFELAAARTILELEAESKGKTDQLNGVSRFVLTQQAAAFEERRVAEAELAITNYPNPFNPVTTIQYELPSDGHVVLSVYDVLGREVARLVDRQQKEGLHRATFDATALATGVYVYRLDAAGQVKTGRMLLLK